MNGYRRVHSTGLIGDGVVLTLYRARDFDDLFGAYRRKYGI